MLITKLVHGLAGAAQPSELQVSSKMAMYADAVGDLPAWTIALASRRWAQGDCPAEIDPMPRFAFPPSPAALRALALLELAPVKRDVRMLENLLKAVPLERAMDATPLPSLPCLPTLRRM